MSAHDIQAFDKNNGLIYISAVRHTDHASVVYHLFHDSRKAFQKWEEVKSGSQRD
jgi:hypothetical protein